MIPNSSKTLFTDKLLKASVRKLSKYLHEDLSAKAIRRKFLDYFTNDQNHTFVRSSPVVPFCDPTVAFVNAGMNQFKGIFLGTQEPQHNKVVNSQKCVRVGGKHNDLNVVGSDGYHHTFFEMLGNWSFGDYFKEEACKMGWKLLTEHYKINKKLLYVTYFEGDKSLGLAPDLECREIWKNIGVPLERILPFGMSDNFWEMGPVGPCGPCTEIHFDHRGIINRSQFVNKGLPDLTELWNIVFIQYNRKPNGIIQPLPQKHIDTGMGLERLIALLQGKISNYDTDLFSGIFAGIHKSCKKIPKYKGHFGEKDWNRLDTSYRILADHARMITACLADGIIPEENQKLRRIIRKAFLVCETNFRVEMKLLKELTNYVVESLGHVYPEMEKQITQIHQILDYEEEIFKQIRANAEAEWLNLTHDEPKLMNLDVIEMPGLIAAYRSIKTQNTDVVSEEMGFKLHDTFGLDEETIINFTNALGLKFDVESFRREVEKAKARSKDQILSNNSRILNDIKKSGIKLTDDSFKYLYKKQNGEYVFEKLPVTVLQIVSKDNLVDEIEAGSECSLILNKTNLYQEAGGQSSDRGRIEFDDSIFEVHNLNNINGYILHQGSLKSPNDSYKLKVNSTGSLMIDKELRMKNMCNHTAAHLLNAAVKQIKGATCQKSSKVTGKYVNLDLGIFGSKLSSDNIAKMEDMVNSVIKSSVDVKVFDINSQELLNMDGVTVIPGEIYPDVGIRLVEVADRDFVSREPCCGTHVLNTSDIEEFCIISNRSLGRSTASLHAVTSDRAKLAKNNAKEILEQIITLQKNAANDADEIQMLDEAVLSLKQRLKYDVDGDGILPLVVKHNCVEYLDRIGKRIKESAKDNLKEFIEVEMQNVLEANKNKSKSNHEFIVHYLECSTTLDTVPLQKATRLCQNLPVLVISYSDNTVKARCCVPKEFVSDSFNAEKWLKETAGIIFRSGSSAPKGQDPKLVCNMKSKKINIKEWDTLLNNSLEAAKLYAKNNL